MTGEAVIPPGSVIVTPEDMWAAIGEIRDIGHRTESAITELRLAVNPAINDLRQDVDQNARIEREHHEKTNQRIDGLGETVHALEKQSWSSRWVPALVSAILAAVVGGVLVYTFAHILTQVR